MVSKSICFVSGTTRIKFSKSEENSAPFIERRRAALERSVLPYMEVEIGFGLSCCQCGDDIVVSRLVSETC